jgi:hypothetical protein
MNKEQARNLVRKAFTQSFDKARFRNFVLELLNDFDESKAFVSNKTYIKDAFKTHVDRFERLGTYTSPGDEKLDVLVVYLTSESKLARADGDPQLRCGSSKAARRKGRCFSCVRLAG